jgi:DNA-binding MarR family transcriptional regulator
MVVESTGIELEQLDLGYLAQFVGQRVNEAVVDRLLRAGFKEVRESHGYVIQHLIERDRSITDLARRMGVTQQAASKTTAEMIRLGILEAETACDRRAKVIRISERGWAAIRMSRRARARIDRRLSTLVGAKSFRRMKAGLIECLTELGGIQRIRSRRVREPR